MIKFFERSKSLIQDNTVVTASSGNESSDRIIDRNPVTYWRSVGSNDMTTETLEIQFATSQTFDRIFVLDHNWKDFDIQYYLGATYVHFASVVGLDGTLSNITETAFSKDTAYYEFTEVTTTKVRIRINKSQVANDEKYGNQIIITSELGTLLGHPVIKSLSLDRQNRNEKMLSGRVLTMKSDEIFQTTLDFKDYPASLSDDIDIMFSLQDIETNFLIWLCGGKYGSNYFKKQMRGYRLRDVIAVQMTEALKPIYSKNVFQNTVNFSAVFWEAVDN
jgi:hypothetical protein